MSLRSSAVAVLLGVSAILVLNAVYTPSESVSVPVVSNSQWDGSVKQVKQWLNRNLKDPDSLQIIEWSPVYKSDDVYYVRVKYRAKNSFGGYTVSNFIFTLDSHGTIVDYTDWGNRDR